MNTNLLTTIHGSNLYGMAHANSDEDTYTVFLPDNDQRKRFAHQTIKGQDDEFRASLYRFLEMCSLGAPQALEAMFSPFAEMDPSYAPFFRSYRLGLNAFQDRYFRTISTFGLDKQDETLAQDNFKKRRHALRLTYNLAEGSRYGRFNPRLAPEQIAFITEQAADENMNDYPALLNEMRSQALLGQPMDRYFS